MAKSYHLKMVNY